jgi:hypothetical protein
MIGRAPAGTSALYIKNDRRAAHKSIITNNTTSISCFSPLNRREDEAAWKYFIESGPAGSGFYSYFLPNPELFPVTNSSGKLKMQL